MKRHKPTWVYGEPFTEKCTVCEATRRVWGGKAFTSWFLGYKQQPYCPGPVQKEVQP